MNRSALALLLLPSLLVPARSGLAQTQPPAPTPLPPNGWRIDMTHSELTFRIRHLVSRVRGSFREWSGVIVTNPDSLNAGSVEVTIQAASIFTNNDRRDADLRSGNFFSVDTFPTLTFKSRKVDVTGTQIRIEGDLTIRNVTKPVVLEGEYLGLTKEQRGRERIGFDVSTKINRLDWGVTWNRAAEGGGVLLGDDVEITIAVAAVRGGGQRQGGSD